MMKHKYILAWLKLSFGILCIMILEIIFVWVNNVNREKAKKTLLIFKNFDLICLKNQKFDVYRHEDKSDSLPLRHPQVLSYPSCFKCFFFIRWVAEERFDQLFTMVHKKGYYIFLKKKETNGMNTNSARTQYNFFSTAFGRTTAGNRTLALAS